MLPSPHPGKEKKSAVASPQGEKSDTDEMASNKKMRLSCTLQPMIPPVDFKIIQGKNIAKKYYDIVSDPPSNYLVERYNLEKKYVLAPAEFKFTLKDWLEGKKNPVFDRHYLRWGVIRLHERLRRIVRALIKVVFDLHYKQQFHGALKHPENYGIQLYNNFKNDADVEVVLLYANDDRGGLPEPTTIEIGVENDIVGLSEIIFDKILRHESYGPESYPQDLIELQSLLNDSSLIAERWLIRSHPYLWHWKAKYYYFEKVWAKYKNGDADLQHTMVMAINNVRYSDWQDQIPNVTPFGRILTHSVNKFSKSKIELLHFVRVTFRHIRDVDPHNQPIYLTKQDDEYNDPQYVEMEMAKLFPMLWRDVYVELLKVEIIV